MITFHAEFISALSHSPIVAFYEASIHGTTFSLTNSVGLLFYQENNKRAGDEYCVV